MSAMSKFAAAAIAILIVPPCSSAQTRPYGHAEHRQAWTGSALSGAYGAASKSSRTTRSAQRARVSRPADASARHVLTPNGRDMGTDPDAAIRFQLLRDYTSGQM